MSLSSNTNALAQLLGADYKSLDIRLTALEAAVEALQAGGGPTPAEWIPPEQGATWQIQYTGTKNYDMNVDVYNIDGWDTTAGVVADLKARGVYTIAYFSAGTWENWRQDADDYPLAVLGADMDDWEGEKWVDARDLDSLMPIIEARLDMIAAKGFDAVDPDNMDGWKHTSGFPLTEAILAAYQRAIAEAAHSRGLACGLKNATQLIPYVLDVTDFAVNEQALQYAEAYKYADLVAAGKAVFNVEYEGTLNDKCPLSPAGWSTIIKDLSLDEPVLSCAGWEPPAAPANLVPDPEFLDAGINATRSVSGWSVTSAGAVWDGTDGNTSRTFYFGPNNKSSDVLLFEPGVTYEISASVVAPVDGWASLGITQPFTGLGGQSIDADIPMTLTDTFTIPADNTTATGFRMASIWVDSPGVTITNPSVRIAEAE